MNIPFNLPHVIENEIDKIKIAINSKKLCGNNNFNKICNEFIERNFNIKKSFLTPSGTSALEMATVVAGISTGDEIIMPSYTFSSTANAFCLRGARPIFAEIEEETFVLDWRKIEPLITKKTKAIVIVNYGGVSPDIYKILDIAKTYNLMVIEDAAQGIDSKYKGHYTGSICPISVFSFHETKNISCGEGGALLLNDENLFEIAEFAQEKGTDRSLVIAGLKDKYSWVSLGSSYLLSEILAGFLSCQLEDKDNILRQREYIFNEYTKICKEFVQKGKIGIQLIPDYCESNFHGFYIVFGDQVTRNKFLEYFKLKGISAYIGYMPLHSSKMGLLLGNNPHSLPITLKISETIVRLPIFNAMTNEEVAYVSSVLYSFLRRL